MHVSWVSGAPYAYALLRHGRRVGNADYVAAAEAVLDHIAGNLTPGGTYWPQWTHDRGWTWGWHPDRDARCTRARSPTRRSSCCARAALGRRPRARTSPSRCARSARTARSRPRYHVATGDAVLVGGHGRHGVDPRARRGGPSSTRRGAPARTTRGFDHWYGAPEDVDLAPTSEDGYAAVMAVRRARGLGDGAARGRLDADVPLHLRRRLLAGARRSAATASARAAPTRRRPRTSTCTRSALICLPEMLRLADATGDAYYRDAALENLACFRQFIARDDGDFGAQRGMAAERYYQTDCFRPKGMLLTRSRTRGAIGVLLYACEELTRL